MATEKAHRFSNLGTGKVFYGKRDFRPDGSYITTEFVALVWMPLVPLRSFRVKRISVAPTPVLLGIRKTFEVLSRGRLNARQVLSVYGFVALLFGFIIGYAEVADYFPKVQLAVHVAIVFAGIAAISFLPMLLRSRAKLSLSNRAE